MAASHEERPRKSIDEWNGKTVPRGEGTDLRLAVSESYSSMTVQIPVHVRRAAEDGPVVFVSAALHGDEINGTGAIRELIQDTEFQLQRGSLVMVPVLNILGFDRHSRYLPDRRDLNRSFPGSINGSLASRMAHAIFQEIVARCDYGIDLHTASLRRTNYPNVRGDLSNPVVKKIAEAFGAELIVNGKGPRGALRREACRAGCPTIILEGGEVWKVEPGIVETSLTGVKNVLANLGMIEQPTKQPVFQLVIEKSHWVRAERGGFLQFHVKPGDVVEKEQPLATNTTLLGREHSMLHAPFNAVVLGMTTLPATSPGEPVCHLGRLPRGVKPDELERQRATDHGLQERVMEDLATNIHVVESSGEPAEG